MKHPALDGREPWKCYGQVLHRPLRALHADGEARGLVHSGARNAKQPQLLSWHVACFVVRIAIFIFYSIPPMKAGTEASVTMAEPAKRKLRDADETAGPVTW